MTPFVITGLPRCRTAWLSHFFTMAGVWCEHEPSSRFESLDDLGRFFETGVALKYRIGCADHGLGWWLPEILERWSPRVLIVRRPLEEVYSDLRGMGLPERGLMQYLQSLSDREQAAKDHPNVKQVWAKSLDHSRTAEKVWFHLLPGVPFDEARFHYMRRFNIQVTRDWIAHLTQHPAPIYLECAQDLKETNDAQDA